MELWTNPDCSKSRTAQQILDEKGVAYTQRLYLMDPPTREELESLLAKGIALHELSREELPEDQVLQRLVEDPRLIQRPIAINGDRAVVARPPERVLEVLQPR